MFISYAQNGEDAMLWRALKEARDGFYIDVGAHHPREDSVTLAFYQRGWRGINIEPVAEGFRRLRIARPRDINLNVAIGETAGSLPFYRLPRTGLSTLDRAQAEEHRAAGFEVQAREVPVVRLDAICRDHVRGPIHFLKIDCEGAEREALASADFAAFRPWIALVEATRPNSQEKNHHLWEPLLDAAGYRFVWFDGLNRFYLAGERFDALKAHFETPLNVFDKYRKFYPPAPRRARKG
jgi:FkbM family methyltransferase